MITIYKYELRFGESEIGLPKDAKILSLQMQREIPCLWAVVDTEKENTKRRFSTYGTGWPVSFPEKLDYIGTIQESHGTFIWHVFERK